jgi:hypothetical protein
MVWQPASRRAVSPPGSCRTVAVLCGHAGRGSFKRSGWPVSSLRSLRHPWFPETKTSAPLEFSGSITKQVNGKKYQAQVFAKVDRLRLEYKYALRTDYGYAGIEIVRLDLAEVWYLLVQQKQLLVTPLDPDDVLPMQPALAGEHSRILIGDATAVERAAQLYEVQTDRRGRTERWYEWVDVETGVVLKLMSRDRDWSFAYERIRWSPQPSQYFSEPPGYQKRQVPAAHGQRG